MGRPKARLFCLAITAALVTAGLSACSAEPKSGSSGDGETIRVLSSGLISDSLLQKFKDKTGISVKWEHISGSEWAQVLQTRVAGKTDIDVLNVQSGAEFNKYAKAGTFADLSGEKFLDNITDVGLKPGIIEGKNFGYARNLYGIGVFYNTDLFTKLGIHVPANWDEFMAAAAKIKADGTPPIVVSPAESWTNQYFYHNAIAEFADSHPDFMAQLHTGESTWKDNDLFTTQIKRVEDLAKAGYFMPGSQSLKFEDARIAFTSGKAAMWLMGSWALQAPFNPAGFTPGAFPLPINAAGEPAARGSSLADSMIAVTSWTKKQDAAKKFLDFLSQKETVAQDAKEQSIVSSVKGATGDFSPYQKDWNALIDAGVPFPDDICPGVNAEGPNLLGQIMAGTSGASQVIDQFQKIQDNDSKVGY